MEIIFVSRRPGSAFRFAGDAADESGIELYGLPPCPQFAFLRAKSPRIRSEAISWRRLHGAKIFTSAGADTLDFNFRTGAGSRGIIRRVFLRALCGHTGAQSERLGNHRKIQTGSLGGNCSGSGRAIRFAVAAASSNASFSGGAADFFSGQNFPVYSRPGRLRTFPGERRANVIRRGRRRRGGLAHRASSFLAHDSSRRRGHAIFRRDAA